MTRVLGRARTPVAPPPVPPSIDRPHQLTPADVTTGELHLGVPVTGAPGRFGEPSYGPLGIPEHRVPGRRFSGTVRREAGPAENLSGLTGTMAIPRHAPLPDPRIPRMEPMPPTLQTVIRQPITDTSGISSCRHT